MGCGLRRRLITLCEAGWIGMTGSPISNPVKSTMSLVTVIRAMARRLPSRDHAKDPIGRVSVKRVS